jgi:hypothetical protein
LRSGNRLVTTSTRSIVASIRHEPPYDKLSDARCPPRRLSPAGEALFPGRALLAGHAGTVTAFRAPPDLIDDRQYLRSGSF